MKPFSGIISSFKQRANHLKKESYALHFAYKDPRTPWQAKAMIIITLCYLLSPIDFIPDFIPVVGYLDDLIIVPLLITLSIKMIPDEVMKSSRIKAAELTISLKKKWWMAVIFVIIWIAIILFLLNTFWFNKKSSINS
ncbi:MAG: DUF1232 domain-containing protein [Chitinophagaceae bacterium]|nr:MAG: DUF1232 domain-containing protein [Chitinophagaceae bacterium]